MKFNFKSLVPALIAVVIFIIFSAIYFSPLFEGKVLSMHDDNMAAGAAQELNKFHEETGTWAHWTNSMFSGMPAFMIAGDYPNSITLKIGKALTSSLPTPINIFVLAALCFYLLLRVYKMNNWSAIFMSIGYAYGTYNIIYIEAGHISKILAVAYLPGVLAGMKLIFDKKYLTGAFVTALFMGLEVYANHVQITYYFMLTLLLFGIYNFVYFLKNGEIRHFLISSALFIVSVAIGVSTNAERLYNNIVYSKETIRGVSELSAKDSNNGLTKNYAFEYSYGIDESFNLINSKLTGGSSSGSLDADSDVYKSLLQNGVPQQGALSFIQRLPLYHGDQSFTSGPAYVGFVFLFLFILGLFIRKSPWRFYLLGLGIVYLSLSWGENFPTVNYWVFDHVPGYNKFRAVSMLLTLVHFIVILGASLSLNELIKSKLDFETLKKPLIYTSSIMIVLLLTGYVVTDFQGLQDAGLVNSLKGSLGDNVANQVLNSLISDRESMALSGIYRGVFLLVLAFLAIYLYAKQKINELVFVVIVGALAVFDIALVDKQYLNKEDFETKFRVQNIESKLTPADQQILNDKDPDFRVLNLTTSFMSDARDSYFHKSLGGYHAAKLMKYQELVENQMTKDGRVNMGVINMLNTKYLIVNGQNGPQVQQNPEVLGNAWFVDSLEVVANADEALSKTGIINTAKVAVIQSKYISESKTFSTNNDTISLKSYTPDKLVYESNATTAGFAVFSEIYYRGNLDWISTIDGVVTNHYPVNYVLRGMEVPAGKHEIVFEFKPKSVEIGEKIDLAGSILLILLGLGALFQTFIVIKNNGVNG